MESQVPDRSVIDIKATAQQHQDIAKQLLAGHALTRCDTVSYMFGIGKLTMLKTLSKQFSLQFMGQLDSDMDVIAEASKFITACYGCKPQQNMSDTRYTVWTHIFPDLDPTDYGWTAN